MMSMDKELNYVSFVWMNYFVVRGVWPAPGKKP
jgi:hypothetical protein